MRYRALGQISFLSLVSIWAGGCAASVTPVVSELGGSATTTGSIATPEASPANNCPHISLISWETPSQSVESTSTPDPFPASKELTVDLLVEQVLALVDTVAIDPAIDADHEIEGELEFPTMLSQHPKDAA